MKVYEKLVNSLQRKANSKGQNRAKGNPSKRWNLNFWKLKRKGP